MVKRANGEGTISQQADGRWQGRLSVIDPKTGLSKRKAVYGKTQAEVVEKMEGLRGRIRKGVAIDDPRQTVAKCEIVGHVIAIRMYAEIWSGCMRRSRSRDCPAYLLTAGRLQHTAARRTIHSRTG